MSRIAIYTYFDQHDKPLYACIKYNDSIEDVPLYLKGTGVSIYDIKKNEKKLHELIVQASANDIDVVTSNFKRTLSWLRLEHYKTKYNVYDLDVEHITPENVQEHTRTTCATLYDSELKPWSKVLANASVVYQAFEDKGISFNYGLMRPKWSLGTSSGRSKVEGGLVHGFTNGDRVRDPMWAETDCLVHFDWISADLRIASILSRDEKLDESFVNADPYAFIMEKFNGADAAMNLTRDEAKIALLSAINSYDVTNPIFDLYDELGIWISKIYQAVSDGKDVYTILGRKIRHKANALSMLNCVMQGSIVHAMQHCIREIWEVIDSRLLAEIHDCIICTCRPEKDAIQELENIVVPIMSRPLKAYGVDTFFPITISIGNEWRKWMHYKTVRNG